MRLSLFLFFTLTTFSLHAQGPELPLMQGSVLNRSCRIKPGTYRLAPQAERFENAVNLAKVQGVVLVMGENVTVDFQNAELSGSELVKQPDQFTGIAIRVSGKNITIKNLRVRGYKIALLADGVDSLTLENCDFSYNYRPKLLSGRKTENEADWLSYHNNDKDEWLRYGAGMYLRGCNKATVKNCTVTGNQNALLMTGCNDALIYNNTFHFNSGLGIGLYRSSRNRIMHNRLDWNVRGYSHGFYQRGQDSAAILLYEQSSNNTIAFNSATHSGDGLFLWAGQSTMDSGEGGCNDNFVFGNDFSHAPTNGVEVTFSRNRIQGNLIIECTYGIWGGYSFGSVISGNYIANCKTGIAIEHGQENIIRQNLLENDSTGIQLWARAEQPADWGYAQKRDVRCRDNTIDRNSFTGVRFPLKLASTLNTSVNGENLFTGFEKMLSATTPNENLKFLRNDLYGPASVLEQVWQMPELTASKSVNFSYPDKRPTDPYAPLMTPLNELKEPDSLPGGMLAALPQGSPRGRSYILVDEWGPYDFQRPLVVLENETDGRVAFNLVGPPGAWKLVEWKGVKKQEIVHGNFPSALRFEHDKAAGPVWLAFEYIGKADITTVFGETIPAGRPYRFEYKEETP